jgi:hypothetical protein
MTVTDKPEIFLDGRRIRKIVSIDWSKREVVAHCCEGQKVDPWHPDESHLARPGEAEAGVCVQTFRNVGRIEFGITEEKEEADDE